MRERLAVLGLGVVIAFTLGACGSDAPRDEPPRHPLVGSSWLLVHVKDSRGDVDIPAAVGASITFSRDTVTGRDGCNVLSARYTRDGDRVTLAEPRTNTAKLCTLTDRAHNAALAAVDAVLRANGPNPQTHLPVRTGIAGDTLTVSYGDVVTLRFTHAAEEIPSAAATATR